MTDKQVTYSKNWDKLLQEKTDKEILKMLSDGLEPQQEDSMGNTLLHAVVRAKKRTELVAKLVAQGCAVNALNKAGWTPLHIAVANGFYEKAKILVKAGADVNAEIKSHEGDRPLHLASWKDDGKMAQLLISQGANLDINGEDGTPLQVAYNLRAYAVARAIIREMRKRKELTLAEKKALPRIPKAEKKATTPSYSQSEKDFEKEIKRRVLEEQLDVNSKDNLNKPLLNRAVCLGTPALVKFLVKRGADVNVADEQDWTPLHLAAAYHSYEKAKILLDNGADIHARFQDHDTPAHMAAWHDDIPLMKLMISHKADMYDSMGEKGTPLQTAWYYRKFKMMRFLENYTHQNRMLAIRKIEDFKKRDDLEKARKISSHRKRYLKGVERER